MSAMTANFRVATPVQISVARDKPAEKETSGGDERFSNLLSQRHARDETTPSQHVAAPKAKEPAKPKESKADDTLHLLHRSAAIQPSVTPPPDPPAQPQPQPQTQPSPPQPTSEAIDDVVSKTPAKASTPVVALPITLPNPTAVDVTAPVAAAPQTPLLPQQEPAATMTAQTTQTDDSTAPAIKPQVAIPTTAAAVVDQTARVAAPPTKTATPSHVFKPTILTASAPTASPQPQTADAKTPEVTPAPLPAVPSPQPEKAATAADAAKPADTMTLQQQPAITSSQADFSNAAPIIIASAVAAAAHHADSHTDSSDDPIDSIDGTTPTGAIPTFSLHEPHDIATADGKTPVPAPSSPEFGDALGAKLSWMAERHIGHAEIRLSPDNLGAVDVRVHLNGDRVRAEFNAANPDVRQAITDHIPRLRDMLSRHGFDLAESHVGNGSQQQNSPSGRPDFGSASLDDEATLPAPHIPAFTHNGILDAFA